MYGKLVLFGASFPSCEVWLQITLDAMKNDGDEVALQGIEFWSTVCDEEADLAIEAVEAAESGHPPEQTSRFYVKGAMPFLVPILLATLTKQVSE